MPALGLQTGHHVLLVLRHDAAAPMVYASLLGPVGDSLVAVAAHHVDVYTLTLELRDGLAGVGLQTLASAYVVAVGGIGGRESEGARLVDDDGIDVAHGLERGGVLDEYAHARCTPYAHHECCGGGESHGAGTGDDQHRHRRHDGSGQLAHAADREPHHEGERREGKYRGHEDGGYPIDYTLHGSLGALGLLHHADNLCQHGLAAYLAGGEAQGAADDDGARQHAVAGMLGYSLGLTAYHALVYRRCGVAPSGDHAVDSHFLSGSHLDAVAGLHSRERHLDESVAAHHARCLGSQAHERAYG